MAEIKRKSFVFYESFYNSIENLERSIQADVLLALVRYALRGEIDPELKPVANALFLSFKPQIDVNNKRFLNGLKGGAPKGNSNAENNQKTTKKQPKRNQKQPNHNLMSNVNVNEKRESTIAREEKSVERAPASPSSYSYFLKQNEKFDERKPNVPTKKQVLEFFLKSGGTMEMAKKFFENNQATGWNYRGSPIKQFEPLANGFIASWQERENKNKPQKPPNNGPTYKDI